MKERPDGRKKPDDLRPIKITTDYLSHPMASVLIEVGGTKVICAASVEAGVPGWMRAQNVPGGWMTCEYSLLPSSTHDRSQREVSKGKASGRTLEIQRLIGRSLRSVVDLKALKRHTIYLDCDVIDADGGTRCASITGASVALRMALAKMVGKGDLEVIPMTGNVAAVSVGIRDGTKIIDLCYEEDCGAEVDMNVVMTDSGRIIEVQGTAEEKPFSRRDLDDMLDLAAAGIKRISAIQNQALRVNAAPSIGTLGEIMNGVEI